MCIKCLAIKNIDFVINEVARIWLITKVLVDRAMRFRINEIELNFNSTFVMKRNDIPRWACTQIIISVAARIVQTGMNVGIMLQFHAMKF